MVNGRPDGAVIGTGALADDKTKSGSSTFSFSFDDQAEDEHSGAQPLEMDPRARGPVLLKEYLDCIASVESVLLGSIFDADFPQKRSMTTNLQSKAVHNIYALEAEIENLKSTRSLIKRLLPDTTNKQ